MPLYHYTCDDGHAALLASDGVMRPVVSLLSAEQARRLTRDRLTRFTSQVIWLTTNAHVIQLNAHSIGLSRHKLDCDRTRHRWEIDIADDDIISSWAYIRHCWPADVVEELESLPGTKPDTWWLSRGPLRAHYAPNRVVA